MCGIVGIFGTNGNCNRDTLEKAVKALNHRGPDGSRLWISEDRKVGLGHARLSIIDLEGGTQPISNEDESIRIVVNGEIYDFEKIRAELKEKGHRFKTGSDSEVLLHLYEEFGLDAIHELRGEFAFVLWDSKTNRIFAGRDRFGIKPLYYTYHNGMLHMASEVKALLAAGVQAKWDEESLYIACHLGTMPMQNRSLFKGIFQVPPGHMLVANATSCRLYKYWDFNYPVEDNHQFNFSDEEAIETFRNYFEEAVKLRLRADVPVGVYLSGGIDSGSILGTIAKYRGSGVKAFSICFEDSAYSEAEVAREMAEFAGAEFIPQLVTSNMIADNFVDSIRHSEILSFNPHSVAKFILSKHVHDSGYKVVLTGEGSDEILAGYAHFRQDLLTYDKSYENSRYLIENLVRENEVSKDFLISSEFMEDNNIIKRRLNFVPSWIEQFKVLFSRAKSILKEDVIYRFKDLDPYRIFLDDLDVHNQLKGRHILNQSLYVWSKLSLPGYLLSNLGDRMEMGHSIEGRVPFLDHKLVEYVTKLPVSLKIRGMTEKYILREALRPVIPKSVYQRQKQPFIAPPSVVIKEDPFQKFICEYIGDYMNDIPFFDKHKLEALVKNLSNARQAEARTMDSFAITIASMAAMQEQFRL